MAPSAKRRKRKFSRKAREKKIEVKQGSNADFLKYDELRAIFQFLKLKELLRASAVCKFWKDAASDEIASRLSPQNIFKRMLFINDEQLWEKPIDDLIIKPYVGIAFEKFDPDKSLYFPRPRFFRYTPPNCERLAMVCGYDIFADNTKIDGGNEFTVVTYLPKIPNLKVNKHQLNVTSDSRNESELFEETKKFFENSVWDSDQGSTCVLLLTEKNNKLTRRIAKYIQSNYKPGTMALWGGVGTYLETEFDEGGECRSIDSNMFLAVCLSSPSLQSWSVVLPKSCMSKDQMKRQLQNFKDRIQLKKYSLAMMCACVARKKNKEIEIDVFKSVFTGIPLVGFSGDGEYGFNTLNTEREKNIQLSYSTVFLILSYC